MIARMRRIAETLRTCVRQIGEIAAEQPAMQSRIAQLSVGIEDISQRLAALANSQAKLQSAVAERHKGRDAEIGRHDIQSARLFTEIAAATSVARGLGNEIATLRRTAASRGNVLLADGRLLTRVSLPEYFPDSDPILFVNAADKLIVPKLAMNGYYELESSHFVGRSVKPRDHVVDVGANFGYYTAMFGLLAGWYGKVVAFEPHPALASLLQENTLINWIEPWVTIVRAACAETPGSMRLYTSEARQGNTGLSVPPIAEGFGPDFAFTPIDVPTVVLDNSIDMLEGRVDFMKVDVEGAEPLVIRGARKTILANPQIKVMMEWSPEQLKAGGFEPAAFAGELSTLGLDLHVIHGKGDVTRLSFATLAETGYQNIALMRSI